MFTCLPAGPTRSTAADRKELHNQQTNIDHLNGTHNIHTPPPTSQQLTANNQSQSGASRENTPTGNATATLAGNSQLGKNDNNSRFTTSNFVESVITPSESVFADMHKNKKRKPNEPSVSTANMIGKSSLHQLTPPPLAQPESERTSSKLSAADQGENNDDDDDDDSIPLKFIEEPNLSTLTNEPVVTSSAASSSPGI